RRAGAWRRVVRVRSGLDCRARAESRLASLACAAGGGAGCVAARGKDRLLWADRAGRALVRRRCGGRAASSGRGAVSEQGLIQLAPSRPAPQALEERRRLERQARLLAWGGIGYHLLEAAVAVAAGVAAGS